MAEASIPVDIFNPGQVFACLGFLEAADVLCGDAKGGFDWCDEANTRFHLRATGDENPVKVVLRFLAKAEVKAVSPARSKNRTEMTEIWKVPTIVIEERAPFPFPDPPSPATLPAMLHAQDKIIRLEYWGDATRRDNVKFWGGSRGRPGAALAVDALDIVRNRIDEAIDDPFALSELQSGSFRFDWRRDYIPLDAGFSPNNHGKNVRMVGYPLVELLAAIGVSHARPQRLRKLEYRYGVVAGNRDDNALLVPIFLRAVLGCAELPIPQRFFHIEFGWPGQEGQARCILDVTEEPNP